MQKVVQAGASARFVSSPGFPIFILVCSSTFWGLSWLPLQFFRDNGLQGFAMILISHSLLTLIALPFSLKNLPQKAHFRELAIIAVAGGAGIFCYTYAIIYGNVVRVMVLFYLLPIWGVLGGRILLNEKIDLIRWIGVLVAIPGAILILGGFKIFDSPPTWIDGLALLSGMSFALNNILIRGANGIRLSHKLTAMFFGCALITAFGFFLGNDPTPVDVPPRIWWYLFLYAALGLLVANFASQWAIERMEAGRSSIILIMQLVAAVVSVTIIGNQSLAPVEWLGGIMVLFAAILESSRPVKAR